jgi:hypothetical protein
MTPTYQYNYKIATYAAGVAGLNYLEAISGLKRPPRGFMTLYPVEYDGGDGRTVGDGYPSCKWVFDWLTQAQLNALRAYVLIAGVYLQSAQVYIRTRKDDGVFANYLAWMHWPRDCEDKRQLGGYYEGVEIEFTNLVAP